MATQLEELMDGVFFEGWGKVRGGEVDLQACHAYGSLMAALLALRWAADSLRQPAQEP